MKKSVIVLLHAGYWLLYLLLIICFIRLLPPYSHKPKTLSDFGRMVFYSPLTIFAIFPAAIGFYSFYTILFSRFLKQKKILALFLFAGLITIISSLMAIVSLNFLEKGKLFINNGWDELMKMAVFLSLLIFIHGTIGLVLRGFIVSYGDIQLKEDLNRKNYETELALLKSQVNPHFLFNTINNIDVLIGKDAVKASEYLNKLSDIMRFMLYETKTDKIELSKELSYIEKYIDLQKIRKANPEYVNYSVEGTPVGLLIEPMLFIPFIENAFKHAENKKSGNAIHVRVTITGSRILFDCENSYNRNLQERPDHGGLGNGLIKKRLQLLYPGSHTLEMGAADGVYKVKLTLVK